MNEQFFSIGDIILLQLFLGSIIYLCGSIILFFLIRKYTKKYNIFLYLIYQFCLSFLLSLLIWQFWAINLDIMIFEIINLPALIAEIITLAIIIILIK